jgi:hypothetical protein
MASPGCGKNKWVVRLFCGMVALSVRESVDSQVAASRAIKAYRESGKP